jgi:hypothetical protein
LRNETFDPRLVMVEVEGSGIDVVMCASAHVMALPSENLNVALLPDNVIFDPGGDQTDD